MSLESRSGGVGAAGSASPRNTPENPELGAPQYAEIPHSHHHEYQRRVFRLRIDATTDAGIDTTSSNGDI